jgi:hypothetical protein
MKSSVFGQAAQSQRLDTVTARRLVISFAGFALSTTQFLAKPLRARV